MESTGLQIGYIPRVGRLEPRIRLTIHRKTGSGIVEMRLSAIEEICRPESESKPDVLAAFRASVPALMGFLNQVIADMPAGGVTVVARHHVRSHLMVKRHGCQPVYYRIPGTTEPLKVRYEV